MIFTFISLAFVAFPDRKDSLFYGDNYKLIEAEASGSIGSIKNNNCVQTFPNETLTSDETLEWCSNVAEDKNDPLQNPWIQYSIKGKQMKITGFAVRNGCCRFTCCSFADNSKLDSYCCCDLYSYSLHGSNDNKTWKVLFKKEKFNEFSYCEVKIFELKKMSEPFKYIRFMLDQEYPNCLKLLMINQIDVFGETISSEFMDYSDSTEDEESVSIIGRVSKEE